jgi:hypothetical protein
MATYVLVEAADDYHVIFSLAELDSSFLDSEVLVADSMDGVALGQDGQIHHCWTCLEFIG